MNNEEIIKLIISINRISKTKKLPLYDVIISLCGDIKTFLAKTGLDINLIDQESMVKLETLLKYEDTVIDIDQNPETFTNSTIEIVSTSNSLEFAYNKDRYNFYHMVNHVINNKVYQGIDCYQVSMIDEKIKVLDYNIKAIMDNEVIVNRPIDYFNLELTYILGRKRARYKKTIEDTLPGVLYDKVVKSLASNNIDTAYNILEDKKLNNSTTR